MSIKVESLGSVEHLQAGLEVSHAELKKQTVQAKRFANADIKNHRQLGNIKGALKVLQPQQLFDVLKSARSAINGQGGTAEVDKQDVPELMAPSNSDTSAIKNATGAHRSTSAEMTALLGEVAQLSSNASLQDMLLQLQSFNAMMNGAGNAYSSLAKELEDMGIQWAKDADALKEAQNQADALAQKVTDAKAALSEAQKALSDLKAQAATQQPVSDELKGKIDAAKLVVKKATSALKNAQTVHTHYVNKTLKPAKDAEKKSLTALNDVKTRSQNLVASFTPQQNNAIEIQRKQSDRNAKSLIFLIALMAELIDKSSSDDLKATAELKQKLSEAAAKDAEKKAKEYEAEVRKSEELQKTMGCIGKTMGWLITAAGFVAAAFTGGAALALAAVGLALAIGDEVDQAITGHSFMQDALKPVMDHVIKPLMDMIGKMFTSVLEGFGVDENTAAMVGQIMGAIAAAAILTVGVMIAGSAISKVFGVVMKKIGLNAAEKVSETMAENMAVEVEREVAEDVARGVLRSTTEEVAEEVAQQVDKKATQSTTQRLMDSAVGQVFKRINQGFGRSLGMDELKMAQVSNRTEIALAGAEMLNTSVQATGDIVAANMMVEASKAKAKMIKDAALQDVLNEMMTRATDNFTHRVETINSIIKNISVVAENQMQAGKYITRKMNSIAG